MILHICECIFHGSCISFNWSGQLYSSQITWNIYSWNISLYWFTILHCISWSVLILGQEVLTLFPEQYSTWLHLLMEVHVVHSMYVSSINCQYYRISTLVDDFGVVCSDMHVYWFMVDCCNIEVNCRKRKIGPVALK